MRRLSKLSIEPKAAIHPVSSMRVGEFNFFFTYHRGTKPLTIVIIHGLGGAKEEFVKILNYPNLKEYNILIPDLVGFGDTSAPEGFGFKMVDQAQAVRQLMEALKIEGGVVLIPQSMGGPIGLLLAENIRELVKGIVWCEGVVDLGDCPSSSQLINSSLEDWVATGYSVVLSRLQGVLHESVQKAGPLSIYFSAVDLVNVAKEDTTVGRLKRLGVPVLVIYGEQNKGKFESERKLGEFFPLIFIPEAGHDMMTDNPDAFYHVVANFLSQLK